MKYFARLSGGTRPTIDAPRSIRSRIMGTLATVAVIAVAATGSIVGNASAPAFAADYPTWSDVQSARSSEAAKQTEIGRIRDLLAQLSANVEATKAEEITRGTEAQVAQAAFDEADYRANQLQTRADEEQATADESKIQAGQLAARLARSGGDVSASLFFDGNGAADLLSQLGMASKITDQSAGVYEKAIRDQNTAQASANQADVAKAALQALSDAAAAALDLAVAASAAAAAALVEQQNNEAVLNAQLAVLVENRVATENDFNAGVIARAAEAARIAEVERQAQLAWAAANPPQSSGSSGSGGTGGEIASSGWARPASGSLTSAYGYRIHPIYHTRIFHAGTDFGASCGTPIFAAAAGVVARAGWNGGYGNYIAINHAGGVQTAYAHIVNGGLLVGQGQSVSEGQLIARVGTTGGSTGCHLHFEVRVNGSTTDPVPFMRARGVNM
ncbi:MAG: peptidoglycan DD-metalloendopeptidase family protein [Burkholderiaceae bacterium]|nr:peptidoglycan DD-metalloendopeptidase family protein [Microbacteriaceae bacterium]